MSLFVLISAFLFSSTFGRSLKSTTSTGFTCESIEYDEMNDVYWLSNDDDNTIVAFDPDTLERRSNMTLLDTGDNTWDSGLNANDTNLLQFPLGLYKYPKNELLYVGSGGNGYVLAFNTSNSDIVYGVFLGANHFPNGVCYNNETDTIFVTDIGANLSSADYRQTNGQQLWELSMELEVLRTFLVTGQNLYPNGCAIQNDNLYVAQNYLGSNKTIQDSQNVLVFYDISTMNESDINTTIVGDYAKYNVTGDGVVFDEHGNLFISSWGAGGEGDGYITYLKEGYVNREGNFAEFVGGLTSAADIGYDTQRHLLLIPEMQAQQFSTIKDLHGSGNSNGSFTSSGAFYGIIGAACGVFLIVFVISLFFFRQKVFFCFYDDDEPERRSSQYQIMNTDDL